MFTRKGDGEPHDHLSPLTRAQARRVRTLFRQAMAERGRELVVSGGHARDARGTRFSVQNIAAICRNDPRGEQAWPELIAGYADAVLAVSAEGTLRELAGLTAEQVLDHVFAVVVPASALGPALASHACAPEVVPGLLELMAFDRPDSWVYLDDDKIAQLGGRVRLRDAALASLRALPAPDHLHLDRDDGNLDVIYGESPYTSSRLLTLPHLLARPELRTKIPGAADARYGVLTAMPCRRRAHLHVLRDSTALASLQLMARYTRLVYGEEPGPVSPDVFWWHDGTWTALIGTRDGQPVLRVPAELVAIIRELAASALPAAWPGLVRVRLG